MLLSFFTALVFAKDIGSGFFTFSIGAEGAWTLCLTLLSGVAITCTAEGFSAVFLLLSFIWILATGAENFLGTSSGVLESRNCRNMARLNNTIPLVAKPNVRILNRLDILKESRTTFFL